MFWGFIGIFFACEAAGIPLIALPGTGLWGGVGWTLATAGFAFLWPAWKSRGSAEGDDAMTEDKSINITTHGQSGGTNVGQLNIVAPQPSLKAHPLSHGVHTDNGFETVVAVDLTDQYAAGEFAAAVEGTSVQDIAVRPDVPASISAQSASKVTPAGGVVIQHPPLHPRYLVSVLTEKPDDSLKIQVQLQ
jgi:hypothetical protein